MKTPELIQKPSDYNLSIPPQPDPFRISYFEQKWVQLKVLGQLLKNAHEFTGSWLSSIQAIKNVRTKYRKLFGEPFLTKISKVDHTYYYRLAAPGYPSMASNEMHKNVMTKILPQINPRGLRSLIFAITKKCPLNCLHCVEWYNLNQEDTLSKEDIIKIVYEYQEYGTTQIMFSGGEPMTRYKDLIDILASSSKKTDFWIITSGIGVNIEKAKALKAAGLSGIMVSLDHFIPDHHDQFRGLKNSFEYALKAILSANEVGLVTALSLCVNKDYLDKDFLQQYMTLAKKLGTSFVQILEPRATGRYAGQSVEISDEQKIAIESIYLDYNSLPQYSKYPIIHYLGYHQRRVGCFGGGSEFMNIDTDGDAHICPFCTDKVINALDANPYETIRALSEKSCGGFEKLSKINEQIFKPETLVMTH